MKKQWLLYFIIASFIPNVAPAQKRTIHFRSINQGAILFGESRVSGALQTVNGIRFSNWLAAAGIGVDYYRYKSVPVFFDARRYIGKEKQGFLYADLGYNFPLKNIPGTEVDYQTSYYFAGGIYTDFGIGVQVPLHNKTFLLFSFGYSSKKMEINTTTNLCGIVAPCWVDYSKYDYNLKRIVLKAGLGF